jgi:hypothetical protein
MKVCFSIPAIFCSAALTIFMGCGNGGSNKPPANITIKIAPKTVSLKTGAQQVFTASVTGTDKTGVNWSLQEPASGATLTSNGQTSVYTAPMTAGTYHVIAASVTDKTKSDVATIEVVSAGALNYTDPVSGNYFRFIKNVTISTPTHLVLDLVAAGQANECAGLAFSVSINGANTVHWAKVAPSDPMLIQNGAVFNLGNNPVGLKTTVENNQLKAVIAQKGTATSANPNSGVLARIALDCSSGAPSGTISLVVNKFQIISGARAIMTISTSNVRFGTLAIT